MDKIEIFEMSIRISSTTDPAFTVYAVSNEKNEKG